MQGGGAHGAFTWGVLDRLLDEDDIDIGWVSATSAGAVNAVALASGLAEGDRDSARRTLRTVWNAVVEAGVPEFIRINPFLYGLTRSSPFTQMASLFSPYELNPLGFDPLRKLLESHIDFDRIRSDSPVELMLAATDVATGRARHFTRTEMTVECVLASACLPTLHHAVRIGGSAYWDGGFSANPDLVRLVEASDVGDTLLVQLNALTRASLPKSVAEITGHTNRLTFNAPLLRDIEIIDAVRQSFRGTWFAPASPQRKLARHRFHMVDAGRYTAGLSADSKLKPDAGLFAYLHGAGRTEMHKWLSRHKADIGRRETADLPQRFLANSEPLLPREAEPVPNPAQPAPDAAPAAAPPAAAPAPAADLTAAPAAKARG
mgnify:CR=1 FL=1